MEIGRIILTAVLFFLVYLVGYNVGKHAGVQEFLKTLRSISQDTFDSVKAAFDGEMVRMFDIKTHPPDLNGEHGNQAESDGEKR